MVRTVLLGLAIVLVLASSVSAVPSERLVSEMALRPGERPDALPPLTPPARSDTVWFGGQGEDGLAYEGGIWDWDAIISDPQQGWTSVDLTTNPGVYFAWVTRDSFLVHGDPCIPLFPDSTAMIWCGIHQDEADERDFGYGMGYQNLMCQRAFSPELPINPLLEPIEITFDYFNDTEEEYDYTYIYVLAYDGNGDQVGEHLVDYLDGKIGDPDNPAVYEGEVMAGTLPLQTETVQIELRMIADGGWSDEDGRYDSACGPFGADNVVITIGWSVALYDFDDGPQDWAFERCEGVGAYMSVVPEEVWTEWTDHAGVTCDCSISGNAMAFADVEGSPFWPPGHPVAQAEAGISNVIPRGGYAPPMYNEVLCRWHQYVYLRYSAGTFYRAGYMIYPYTTEVNPEPHWSARRGQDTWYYTGDTPDCYETQANFTHPPNGQPLPAEWDSLRAIFEVTTSCDNFGIPEGICTYEGETWGSPLIDRLRVGLTHSADAPGLTLETGHVFVDGFGQRFPYYLEPSDVGNADVGYDMSRDDWDQNDWYADSAMVIGPNVDDEEDRWCVDLCFRLPRTGPRQQMIPGYQEWKARFQGDPEVGWVCARMDSYENWQGSWPHKYHTYFHEDDPGHDPRFHERSPMQEILRDSLLTPGTQVEYYYRGYWYDGGAPPEEYSTLGPWEMEILPGMRALEDDGGGSDDGYDWAYPCLLYIDAYNRGAEYYILPTLDEIGIEYDRYDSPDGCS